MTNRFASCRRGLITCLGSALFLIISASFALPPLSEAGTDVVAHRSASAMPPGMRRVTVTSKPIGATIYVDGIQAGRTPISFPMPTGRYTLILVAPGHQQFGERILVGDAPLEIHVNLVPYK